MKIFFSVPLLSPSVTEIYRSFVEDDEMLATLLPEKPKVVSFHFGIPAPERVRALRDAGTSCWPRLRILRRRKPSPMLADELAEGRIVALGASFRLSRPVQFPLADSPITEQNRTQIRKYAGKAIIMLPLLFGASPPNGWVQPTVLQRFEGAPDSFQ